MHGTNMKSILDQLQGIIYIDTISNVMAAQKQLLSSYFKINCSWNTSGFQNLLVTRMPDKRPHTYTSFGKMKNMSTLTLIKQQKLFSLSEISGFNGGGNYYTALFCYDSV